MYNIYRKLNYINLPLYLFPFSFFVFKFCYLGDMLSVDGDADAAMEARIRIGWNILGQLVPLLTNRDISLIRRGRLCSSCVRSTMLHRSKTWLSGKKMRFHFSEQR